MSDSKVSLSTDTRNNLRVEDSSRVLWQIKEGVQRGKAKIRNISSSGMLLETNGTFIPPKEGCIFSFDTTLGHDNYIPQYGQLIWSHKIGRYKNKYRCGIQFFEPSEYVQTKLRQRIQKGILRITTVQQLTQIFGGILTVAIVGLTGYTVWMSQDIYQGFSTSTERLLDTSGKQAALTRNYAQRYQESQQQLAATQQELAATKELYKQSESQLSSATQELNETKMILAQTEAMLVEAKSSQNNLQTVVSENEAQFANSRAQFEKDMAVLQEENIQLQKEVATLQEQLSFYEGNVKNIDEGYVLVNIYRERMAVVQDKIKDFKRQARDLKRKVQNERDRIQLNLGNNGFMVREGQAVKVDMEKYLAVETADISLDEATVVENTVEINVTNFE
ncbi:MAG TPA: PilZ domain-containing protein [Candidatus Omnitrophota bacterium]|nr:PilZ domain-containing protein [Candidatus Omnitrophota bacterium]